MLAGCSSSSTLLSPRHRLRSEAPQQFQACHFPMSAQRLDLPCTASFSRKDPPRPAQPLRPAVAGLSIEKPAIDTKTAACSLRQSIRLPPLSASEARRKEAIIGDDFWDNNEKEKKKKKSLKRFAEQEGSVDDDDDGGGESERFFFNRAKRKRGISIVDEEDFGPAGSFWLNPQVPFTLACSGSEEKEQDGEEEEEEEQQRVCYVLPGEAISSPVFPLSHNPWIESVITELGEKDGDAAAASSSRRHLPKDSGGGSSAASSTSSGSRSRTNRLLGEAAGVGTEHDIGNGSRNPYYYGGGGGSAEAADDDGAARAEAEGLELISHLASCVEAIGSKSVHGISHYIAKLSELASPRGTSPLSRVMAYYTEALALRVTRLWPQVFHVSPPRDFERLDVEESSGSALRFLNQATPIPKFIHFTANEMLLRAFEGKDRVHVIDFDIKQGLQWPSFFQSLASRANPPSHVRITGVGESKQELNETGDRLAGFADALSLPFEFHAVVDRLEDVRLWMLHVKEGESVAVNCLLQLHKTLYDGSGGALRDFLGLVRSAGAAAVVVAEQEAEHNAPGLEARVCDSLRYYSALFDCVGASGLPAESAARARVEEMFGREIRNIVACEGADRSERHVGFPRWRGMLMEQGGFRPFPGDGAGLVMQGRMLLKMYGGSGGEENDGYNVREQEEGFGITLGWRDQPLFTVSAWTPLYNNATITIGGGAATSSSLSQPS